MNSQVPVEEAESVRAQREQLPLYTARVKVFPKQVAGIIRRAKWAVLVLLLGIYYLAPWLRWDRGPDAPNQAFLIDMPARRAYFMWIEIWPHEVYYLAGLLMIGAFGLFLATALFGRVWCGFTCPQTVWTDLFIMVERWIEGDRNARIKLDKGPWNTRKIAKRAAKHVVWIVISVLTGGAWVLYFNDAPTLVQDALHFEFSKTVLFFIGLFAATTYLLAGFAREQVCTYMCPWPRFQSAMFDEDSLIVTYEAWRGEPRGRLAKAADRAGKGDCVACNQCVAVCPTGIDIRDGNQLECIGCGLCIDACNRVMARIGRPRNLITYDSINRQNARAVGGTPQYRLVRPRTLAYLALLCIVGGGILFGLVTRKNAEIDVLRDRNPLFVTLSDGSIRNGYTFKILNKKRATRAYVLSIDGLPEASMTVVGQDYPSDSLEMRAAPDTVTTYHVFVRAPRESVNADIVRFDFVLAETPIRPGAKGLRYKAIFRGPAR
jgi:cytochrome c oxidase accessory protein FixG